jgi:Nuclease A inhibitor-like protein
MNTHPILALLKKACHGLVFPSETDAPLEPFLWEDRGDMNSALLLSLTGADKNTPVETMKLADFFYAVPKDDKPPFEALAKLLTDHLADVKVYKVGAIEMKVYIVGKTNDGRWAGIMTEVVET